MKKKHLLIGEKSVEKEKNKLWFRTGWLRQKHGSPSSALVGREKAFPLWPPWWNPPQKMYMGLMLEVWQLHLLPLIERKSELAIIMLHQNLRYLFDQKIHWCHRWALFLVGILRHLDEGVSDIFFSIKIRMNTETFWGNMSKNDYLNFINLASIFHISARRPWWVVMFPFDGSVLSTFIPSPYWNNKK